MKGLLIYLSFFVLTMAISAPALAQMPQEDAGGASGQYNNTEDPCEGLLGAEFDECLIETYPPGSEHRAQWEQYQNPSECDGPRADPFICDAPAARHAIPEANKSSKQTFEGFSKTLSEIRSGEQNEAEAEEAEVNKPSSKPGSGEPSGTAAVAAADDEPVQPSESGEANEAEAVRPALKDPDTDQKAGNEQDGAGSGSKNSVVREDGAGSESKTGVGDEAEPVSGSRDTATGAPDATAPPSVTVLPETSGGSFVLVGVGILLLVGGLTVGRLFR